MEGRCRPPRISCCAPSAAAVDIIAVATDASSAREDSLVKVAQGSRTSQGPTAASEAEAPPTPPSPSIPARSRGLSQLAPGGCKSRIGTSTRPPPSALRMMAGKTRLRLCRYDAAAADAAPRIPLRQSQQGCERGGSVRAHEKKAEKTRRPCYDSTSITGLAGWRELSEEFYEKRRPISAKHVCLESYKKAMQQMRTSLSATKRGD
jgi:hypothetical protein